MTQKLSLLLGILFSGLAVALGAFGAHALKEILVANNRLETFETAVRYQMYHGLALIAVGILMGQFQNSQHLSWAAWSFIGGILLFSGSLYGLSFLTIRAIAFLTPLGGLFFLAGWALMLSGILKKI